MRNLIACILIILWAMPLHAQQPKVTPSHVYQHVGLVRSSIELIRLEMGKGVVPAPMIEVSLAEPRQVIFQALTLFRKADRLAFEHTGERVLEPSVPTGEIEPADVFAVVEQARDRVAQVTASLGITQEPKPAPLQTGLSPSQVFSAIVTANRELNQLLDRPFAPADVYQEVTKAIAYASRLLDTSERVATPPEPPPLERRKRPHDVYHRLLECYAGVHEVGKRSDVPMLELKIGGKWGVSGQVTSTTSRRFWCRSWRICMPKKQTPCHPGERSTRGVSCPHMSFSGLVS